MNKIDKNYIKVICCKDEDRSGWIVEEDDLIVETNIKSSWGEIKYIRLNPTFIMFVIFLELLEDFQGSTLTKQLNIKLKNK